MKSISKEVKKRICLMLAGIIGIGVFISFLIEVNYGTDTCSFMVLALSTRFGISFGTCVMLVNILLFIPVVLFERKLINIGTIINMFFVGYICDFCRGIWARYLPAALFTVQPYRTLTFVIALFPLLISVALYMNANLGLVPYDALPTIISHRFHFPFPVVRIVWDFTAILIGILAGKHLSIATVILAFAIGPSVTFIGNRLKPLSEKSQKHALEENI